MLVFIDSITLHISMQMHIAGTSLSSEYKIKKKPKIQLLMSLADVGISKVAGSFKSS
jgi:hypothetical protein